MEISRFISAKRCSRGAVRRVPCPVSRVPYSCVVPGRDAPQGRGYSIDEMP
jgi:hypothetical protein